MRHFHSSAFFTRSVMRRIASALAVGLALAASSFAAAANPQTGSSTGLPIPRFVSLKWDRMNLREGPSKAHRTTWIFQRAGLPVEITAESDIWRRIRDSEGSEGWVLHSLLSGRRTGLVAPWRKGEELPLRADPREDAPITARLQNGVIGQLKKCDGTWCYLIGEGFKGWISQDLLWGAYPGEKIE